MKIAYILKMYPRFSETFIVNEILELERQGVDVRIYSLRKPDDGRFHAQLSLVKANVVYTPEYPDREPERVQAAEDTVRAAYPERYLALRAYAESRGHPYAIKRFQQACVIAAHLLGHPVHAMHAHFASSASRVANYVKHLIGLPYSIAAHAKDIYHEDVQLGSLQGKIRDARFVVTVSRFNQAHLQALMGDQSADIRCLYNGIDRDRFQPGADGQRQPNLILGVGRLVEKKGFADLIRACHLLRQWGVAFRCEIIGKGDLRDSLQMLIDELDLADQVKLIGPQPQDGVLEAYRRSVVFALPCIIGSDGNRDGLPTVLLEAMSTGLPVVSTALTGIPEIIDHDENGLIVPPGDPETLAHALASLLQNHAYREQMGKAAQQKVACAFDVRHNVAQLHRWLAEPIREPAYQSGPIIVDSPYSPLVQGELA
ncbi:MAG: glycosyltransferase [Ardenticatenaceae bacterium]|nr:glycosyltransferase [Ardenticatenaceae bacterium]